MSTTGPKEHDSDERILPPEEAGTLFVPPDGQLLIGLRRKLNDAIRATERGKPVLIDVARIRSDLAKRLAEECEQGGWSVQIVPVDSWSQVHPLQTGSILKLTHRVPHVIGVNDGNPKP